MKSLLSQVSRDEPGVLQRLCNLQSAQNGNAVTENSIVEPTHSSEAYMDDIAVIYTKLSPEGMN
jgi:hypothetical protein